jgi:ABC-2 type transport system permease protein
MTLLATERIKLFTTRSPWWCMLIALVLTVGFSVAIIANASDVVPASVANAESGYQFGVIVIMVMAALAVTTEYGFGTIRASFQAVPNRTAVLLAKVAVVGILAAVIGEISAFLAWGAARLIKPGPLTALDGDQALRNVFGMGLVYLVAAVIAVSVGILIRQSAGAIAILLVYVLLVESLVTLIPTIGPKIQEWMPFNMAHNFLSAGAQTAGGPEAARAVAQMPLSAWGSLAYFAGFGVVILAAALFTANRRDA